MRNDLALMKYQSSLDIPLRLPLRMRQCVCYLTDLTFLMELKNYTNKQTNKSQYQTIIFCKKLNSSPQASGGNCRRLHSKQFLV